jgi:choline kinase
MRAIILAAGAGQRLSALGSGRGPKSLLRFGKCSLMERHIRMLHGLGVREIAIVVGFEAHRITEALAVLSMPRRPILVHNAACTEGSVVSLHTAARQMRYGGPVLLMDADVLYDWRMLARLIESPYENCFLLDRDYQPGEEPVKLCVRAGQLIEFRKRLAPGLRYDASGESVGFFKLSGETATRLAARVQIYVGTSRRDQPYEEPLRDLLLARPQDFAFEDITGQPWLEIDFPADVQRAQSEILPRLKDPWFLR